MPETRLCKAITHGGARCSSSAQEGSEWCWNHDRDRVEERRTDSRAGGKTRSRRSLDELERIKEQLRTITAGVLEGRIDRDKAAVLIEGFNTLVRLIEVQRNLEFQRDLEAEAESWNNLFED
jgi:hypothetical protein